MNLRKGGKGNHSFCYIIAVEALQFKKDLLPSPSSLPVTGFRRFQISFHLFPNYITSISRMMSLIGSSVLSISCAVVCENGTRRALHGGKCRTRELVRVDDDAHAVCREKLCLRDCVVEEEGTATMGMFGCFAWNASQNAMTSSRGLRA